MKYLVEMTNNIRAGKDIFGTGPLRWNLYGQSCVNHTATALWAVGVPTLPINIWPPMLNAQLLIRQAGIYASPYFYDRK